MTRRTPSTPRLPGAAELFRTTTSAQVAAQAGSNESWFDASNTTRHAPSRSAQPQRRRGSPRQKHSSKITVYVSDEELLALEHVRLALRGTYGLAVDRGRVVREAVAIALADLEEHGEDSMLVRRLRQDSAR